MMRQHLDNRHRGLCLRITVVGVLAVTTSSVLAQAPAVWAGDGGFTTGFDGGIQRYDVNRNPVGSLFGGPRVHALAVVGSEVWAGDGGDTTGFNGGIRRYSFNGVAIGSLFGGPRCDAIVVANGQVWAGDNGDTSANNGGIQRYSFAGSAIGTKFASPRSDALLVVSSLVWSGDGGNTTGGGGGIFKYNFTPAPVGGVFGGARCDALAIVNGQVWAGDNGNTTGSGGGIQRYDFNGTAQGSFFGGPRVDALAVVGSEVWAGDGGFTNGSGGGIQRYDFNGTPIGGVFGLSRVRALALVQLIDCNSNGINDGNDIAQGTSLDCDFNLIPDKCQIPVGSPAPGGPFYCTSGCDPDCNTNAIPDSCDLASMFSRDCNSNSIPDLCDILTGFSKDCNTNGRPDSCDISHATSADCNTNTRPDECDILGATSADCNLNAISDECEAGSGNRLWIGATGSSFTDSSKWSPSGAPSSAGRAILTNNSAIENRSILSAGGTTTVCSVALSGAGSGRQILQINQGSNIATNDGFNLSTNGDVDLQGGQISGETITNDSNSISGYGTISADLVNLGLVEGRLGTTLVVSSPTLDNQATGRLLAPFSSLIDIRSTTILQGGLLELRPLSGMHFDGPLANLSGGSIELLDAALHATSLSNSTGATIEGFGTIDCDLANDGDMLVIANMQILGSLVNDGTVIVQSGILTITGGVSGGGTIIGTGGRRGGDDDCGGLNINGDYHIGSGGSLDLACGTLRLGGDFDLEINDYERFDLSSATLQMVGLPENGVQSLEVAGTDLGCNEVSIPSQSLFSIGRLRIGPTATTVRLIDNHDNSPGVGAEALYVSELVLDTGVTLDLSGFHLYYVRSTPSNPYAIGNGVQVVDSVGGGVLCRVTNTIAGDLDADGDVDLNDLVIFVNAAMGTDTSPDHLIRADVNADGRLDGRDIPAFIQALVQP